MKKSKKKSKKKHKNPISPADLSRIYRAICEQTYAMYIGQAILDNKFEIKGDKLIIDLSGLSPVFRPVFSVQRPPGQRHRSKNRPNDNRTRHARRGRNRAQIAARPIADGIRVAPCQAEHAGRV
jgi:hypothetical protein